MNKKEECEMVKDLSIPFIEKTIHKGSEDFVKVHLENCGECKEYYKNMENRISKKRNIEKENDTIVFHQFKKINKRMRIFKMSLMVIIIAIIMIVLVVYIKNQKVVNIVNNAYEKIEFMRELNNYKLTVRTIEKNLQTNEYREYEENCYYKNGKYKIESIDSMKFYEDNSYEKICVYPNLKQIDYYKQDFIEETKGRRMGVFSEIINYKKISSTFYNLALSVREEKYNGIDCYVIRFGNKNSYRDTWIDKNSYITLRVMNETAEEFYREEVYTFYENVTKDEDVDRNILNSDIYKEYTKKYITNNGTEEVKCFFELYN